MKEDWRGRFFENFEVGDVCRHPLGRGHHDRQHLVYPDKPLRII
ncbi:MAG: hypothetical protein WKF95_05310 [Rubrobacter sp.]